MSVNKIDEILGGFPHTIKQIFEETIAEKC
jgi:hypothetical protein